MDTVTLRVIRRLVVGTVMRYPGELLALPADEAAALAAARGEAVEIVAGSAQTPGDGEDAGAPRADMDESLGDERPDRLAKPVRSGRRK
jgi:hypothetical protein